MSIGGISRSRAAVLALAVTAVAAMSIPSGAGAGPGHTVPDPALERAVIGGDPERLPNGLYKLRLENDKRVLTHGPDLKAFAGPTLGLGDPERPPVCATDYYQRVLYAYPKKKANRISTVRASIQASIRRMNYLLSADSVASGGPAADYKVFCDSAGQIRVDAYASNGNTFNAIVNSAIRAGYKLSNVDYTIFFDGSYPGVCGIGSYWDDDRLSANNLNNGGGDYAISYFGCWDDETPMHENGHNQGAVQRFAPFSTGTGAHCIEAIDVMCYSPDGGDANQGGTISVCADIHFDCRYNTYFDSAPESGEWLATHWNIGSPLNRFIAFGTTTPLLPPPS